MSFLSDWWEALEPKKRCHDLLHRASDNRDFLVNKNAFSGRTAFL